MCLTDVPGTLALIESIACALVGTLSSLNVLDILQVATD